MAHKTQFVNIPEKPLFSKDEEKICEYWEKIQAFKKQQELTKDCKPYTFYDGPPFATGLPHYGHICAGTIKDVVCRYQAQTGHYVERRFGWDCHGLPVEFEIDKALGIKHKNDVYKMGIDKYNAECRSIVMRYSSEWRKIIGRCGRWIDFDNDYKTLDLKFMESVWWVFKQLWEKGHVYRGCKVMPYSNGCNTVLSNFETQQNYKEVLDPSVYITFPLVTDPDTSFVAWTTTPWTLPTNLALVVHPTFDYVKVYDHQHKTHFILAECRLGDLYPTKAKDSYEIKQRYKGLDLVGTEYTPLFNYFESRRGDGCFRILADTYVTNDTGTGVVHCSPGFGADDYRVAIKAKIVQAHDPPVPIDENGRFKDIIADFKGIYVKDADKEIRKYLKNSNRLLIDTQLRHNYPFCWRSETPLIYKAVHCWFIRVTDFKDNLVRNNKKSYWVPTFAQEGRFNNWLENAEDWCFSRNRFWGNPIPIWVSDDYEEQVCIGSVQELKDLSGVQDITDLHRENIDHITIPSKQGKGVLKRIDEIFDCWFESGSMPFAQQHYPFSTNEEQFKKIFPADFIAEGIDQTRGWFYTLNVIATALRDETPYKNLIVNGLVLNHEGKKMSKSKKNYPDPMEIINLYGADAMRLYLINSPLVKAETLNFKDAGVVGTVRDVFLPWYNAYRFLFQNISRYESDSNKEFKWDESISQSTKLSNFMDKWIIATEQNLIQFVRQEMERYRLYTVVPELLAFLENLTNWYVRLNRPRIKGESGQEDQFVALNVLFDVLLKLTILMSPFVPFITESFYMNFKKCIVSKSYLADSIHFLQIPQSNTTLIDKGIELDVQRMQDVIVKARKIRETKNISLKQPIQSLTVVINNQSFINSINTLKNYIEDEVNTPQLIIETNVSKFVELKSEPNNQFCGKELGEKFSKDFIAKVRALTQDQIRQLQADGQMTMQIVIQREKKQVQQQEEEEQKQIAGEKKVAKKAPKVKKEFEDFNEEVTFLLKHVVITEKYKTDNLPDYLILSVEDQYSLLLDSRQDEKLRIRGLAREFTNRIQKLRKLSKLNVDDKIIIFYKFHENAKELENAVHKEFQSILNQVKKPILPMTYFHQFQQKVNHQVEKVEDFGFELQITYETAIFDTEALKAKYGVKLADLIQNSLASLNTEELKKYTKDGVVIGTFDNQVLELKDKVDIFLNPQDAFQVKE